LVQTDIMAYGFEPRIINNTTSEWVVKGLSKCASMS